jgi:hypothetical protein
LVYYLVRPCSIPSKRNHKDYRYPQEYSFHPHISALTLNFQNTQRR